MSETAAAVQVQSNCNYKKLHVYKVTNIKITSVILFFCTNHFFDIICCSKPWFSDLLIHSMKSFKFSMVYMLLNSWKSCSNVQSKATLQTVYGRIFYILLSKGNESSFISHKWSKCQLPTSFVN